MFVCNYILSIKSKNFYSLHLDVVFRNYISSLPAVEILKLSINL